MVNHPDSNREWQRMLSSVAGVYVISAFNRLFRAANWGRKS